MHLGPEDVYEDLNQVEAIASGLEVIAKRFLFLV